MYSSYITNSYIITNYFNIRSNYNYNSKNRFMTTLLCNLIVQYLVVCMYKATFNHNKDQCISIYSKYLSLIDRYNNKLQCVLN